MAGRDDWGSFAPLKGKESRLARKQYSKLMNSTPRPDYSGFARQALDMNIQDFSASTERKRELLHDYFPGRYEQQGWRGMDALKIGSLFKKIYEYSKKHSL